MVSGITFINNGCRFECSVAGFQDKAVWTGIWGTEG